MDCLGNRVLIESICICCICKIQIVKGRYCSHHKTCTDLAKETLQNLARGVWYFGMEELFVKIKQTKRNRKIC